jgi:hypothetical protein
MLVDSEAYGLSILAGGSWNWTYLGHRGHNHGHKEKSVTLPAGVPLMKFHERFDINVGLEDAQRRFANRVYNELFVGFVYAQESLASLEMLGIAISTELGEPYPGFRSSHKIVGTDFLRSLRAIEAVYSAVPSRRVSEIAARLLAQSEVDLGIEWREGKFYRKGAALLDQKLVNDVLHWLRGAGYESVFKPFEKGLGHLLEAPIKKEHLSDVITDMYEAVEALAKIVTGRNKDLSGNAELFMSKVKASEAYKVLLKDYVEYANKFRHAEAEGKPKPVVFEREVESFVYMTGIFIRLAMP